MMCCHFGELKDGVAVWCPAHAGMGFGSLLAQARKNFAPLVHTDFAAVAKAPCKHGLWLVAREKKEPFRFRQAQELLRKYKYVYDVAHTMISLAASFFCLRDSAHAHLTPSASN